MNTYTVRLFGKNVDGQPRTVYVDVEADTAESAIDAAWKREWALMTRAHSFSTATPAFTISNEPRVNEHPDYVNDAGELMQWCERCGDYIYGTPCDPPEDDE